MENITNHAPLAKVYVANDLNFQDYGDTMLEYICKYRIPLRSKYPKLVIDLFTPSCPKTSYLRHKIAPHMGDDELIRQLIHSVHIRASESGSQHPISFVDERLWSILHNTFQIRANQPLREKHETQPLREKHETQPLREKHETQPLREKHETQQLREKHENSVLELVNTQQQQNTYFNYNDTHLNIQQSRRTRKHQRPTEATVMKYHRQLYI